jgi:hypothetical protein
VAHLTFGGAVAQPPCGQQGGQIGGPAGAEAAGGGEFLASRFQSAGEAGPVGVGAGPVLPSTRCQVIILDPAARSLTTRHWTATP